MNAQSPDADELGVEGAVAGEVPERLLYTSAPALLTALLLSLVLFAAALFGWWAIGADLRASITAPQAITLLVILVAMIGIMMSVGYSRLWADGKSVTVRNGPLLRRFDVDDIAGLRMRSGDAWAYLLIRDGEGELQKRAVLAIQHLEGAGGRRKLRELRAWLVEHRTKPVQAVDPS